MKSVEFGLELVGHFNGPFHKRIMAWNPLCSQDHIVRLGGYLSEKRNAPHSCKTPRWSCGQRQPTGAAPVGTLLTAAKAAMDYDDDHTGRLRGSFEMPEKVTPRSEEHTSELKSRRDIVCRLL